MPNRPRVQRRDLPGAMGVILLEVAAGFGVPTPVVLAGTAIDELALSAPDTRIGEQDHLRMLANCLQASGEPAFALHYGSRIPVVALGVLGYALMCCRHVQELIEFLGRYHRLISAGLNIAVLPSEEGVSVALLGAASGQEPVQALECEVFFAAAAASLRQLGVGEDVLRLELAYPDPGYAARYREIVCHDLVFDAPTNRLSIDQRALALPLQFANPVLLNLYRQQCEEMLSRLQQSSGYSAELRSWLLAEPGRFPGFEEAAVQLHMSPRTLRRRLEEEGTSYQRIVHELRRQLAETYLRDSMLSIAEIADMLGYRDLSNFRRAFISWTGRSPAGYRRSLRGGRTR
jgi:AraC-like DNA-binding protein